MFKSNLKTAWRSLRKNLSYSFINILGLAVGIAAFLLISIYVRYEIGYDQFLDNKENIYRVQTNRYNKGEISTQWAAGCAAIGPELKKNYPEVEKYVTIRNAGGVMQYGDKHFKENNTYFATSTFFEVFSIPLIEGVDSLVLKEPNTMVISQSTARKYFGDENPMGKTLKHNGENEYYITGIFKDIPAQSHMNAEILLSYETFVNFVGEEVWTAWNWDGFYNYISLVPGTDYKQFESKIPELVEREQGEEMKQYNAGVVFLLQPVTDIHLFSDFMYEFQANGDGQSTYFLIIIALFIIIIAWVNYVNLSTAKSMERAKEVGIRKVMGSMRNQLTWQFLMESYLLNLFALIVALVLMISGFSLFRNLSGLSLEFSLTDPFLWSTLLVLFVVGGSISGIYPALVLAGFRPTSVLKGKLSGTSRGAVLRKSLVIFQFIASLILMVGTFTVFRQMNYMKSQELGVTIDQTLVLRGPNVIDSLYSDKFNTFKHALSSYASISSVASSTAVPGAQPGWNAGGIRLLEQSEEESNQYRVIGVDEDFVNSFSLEIVNGRNFDEKLTNENESVLFNESALDLIGLTTQEALLNEIFFWGDTFKIVGVLKDYHQESLKKSYEPLIFRYIPNARSYYSIKVNPQNIPQTLEEIKVEWQSAFPGNPFEYFFLDEHFESQYKADTQFGWVFGFFAGLAIFIACLGLFGLASYMTIQRNKEIGVRKVLGATVANILLLLSQDFSRFLIIAILMAIPLSWYLIHLWLLDFANRINISWWLFAVPAIALMLIALITISFQTLKSATTNPVKMLRDE